jgi:hypothetical protein
MLAFSQPASSQPPRVLAAPSAQDFFEALRSDDPLCPNVEALGRRVKHLIPDGLGKRAEPQAELPQEQFRFPLGFTARFTPCFAARFTLGDQYLSSCHVGLAGGGAELESQFA